MNPQPTQHDSASIQPDNKPGGDHDQPYTWGRPPDTYLTFRQVVRLTILRSKLESVRTERTRC